MGGRIPATGAEMTTGPHVIAMPLLVAWCMALVAAVLLTVPVVRGPRTWLSVLPLVVLWVSVLVQILYWVGVGD